MTTITNWASATLFAAMFFGAAHLADQDTSTADQLAAIDAQAQATEARMQNAANALCVADLGHSAQARWTPEGQLVCVQAVASN